MTFKNLKWIFGLVLIFLLILATNLIDDNNFKRIRDSTIQIYDDRLVTKNVVLQLSLNLHEKELAAVKGDSVFYQNLNGLRDLQIDELLVSYRDAKLTRRETETLDLFEEALGKVREREVQYIALLGTADEGEMRERLEDDFDALLKDLDALSEIQLTEGRRQKAIAEEAVNSVELFMQVEMILLVIMAIAISLLLLYPFGGGRKKNGAD